eukprot:Amastigsp_a842286_375.p6 type:complete len:110 gc:universal Amastigsp_a842286_375:349-20(-)
MSRSRENTTARATRPRSLSGKPAQARSFWRAATLRCSDELAVVVEKAARWVPDGAAIYIFDSASARSRTAPPSQAAIVAGSVPPHCSASSTGDMGLGGAVSTSGESQNA